MESRATTRSNHALPPADTIGRSGSRPAAESARTPSASRSRKASTAGPSVELALITGDPGEFEPFDAGGHARHNFKIIDGTRARATAGMPELGQHTQDSVRGAQSRFRRPHAGHRVDLEVDLRAPGVLPGQPAQRRRVEHLVGDQDARHPEPAQHQGLVGRRHGQAPGAGLQLRGDQRRRHRRLGVRREVHAVPGAVRRHGGDVRLHRRPPHHQQRPGEPAVEDARFRLGHLRGGQRHRRATRTPWPASRSALRGCRASLSPPSLDRRIVGRARCASYQARPTIRRRPRARAVRPAVRRRRRHRPRRRAHRPLRRGGARRPDRGRGGGSRLGMRSTSST